MNYSDERARGRGRGRRAGRPDTREQILQAARQRFGADGYQAVSLRAIAKQADVDVALISYYFGSKRDLFAASVDLEVSPPQVLREELSGDPDRLAERILARLIAVWDDPQQGAPLVAMLTAILQEPRFGKQGREFVEREILRAIADHIGGIRARYRASAIASTLLGLLVSRYIIHLEPAASMPADEIVRAYAPLLRSALADPRRAR
ncbi:MAG: TetR family transcriptional regulator [Actinomycetia bacterium]|nr:TetR family transcriptional regulator [Actinomycetes bacterium]